MLAPPGCGRCAGGIPSSPVGSAQSARLTGSHSSPWHRAVALPGAGLGTSVTAPPAPLPSSRQCPARRHGRWRRRRSTPRPFACCGARPRPAASTARSAATRSTTCAWRAQRPEGRRASRTSCWPMPRWAGLRAGPGGGAGRGPCAPAVSPLLSFSLWLPRSPPPLSPAASSPLSGRWTTRLNM